MSIEAHEGKKEDKLKTRGSWSHFSLIWQAKRKIERKNVRASARFFCGVGEPLGVGFPVAARGGGKCSVMEFVRATFVCWCCSAGRAAIMGAGFP